VDAFTVCAGLFLVAIICAAVWLFRDYSRELHGLPHGRVLRPRAHLDARTGEHAAPAPPSNVTYLRTYKRETYDHSPSQAALTAAFGDGPDAA
jgi:hypothetical protein